MDASGSLSRPLGAPADGLVPLSLRMRYASFAAMLLLCAGLAWLWTGSPPSLKWGGLAAALLALFRQSAFFGGLALALPWLANQPNPDQQSLLLIEYGLAGLAIHHQALRAVGLAPRRASRLDPWLALFVFYSCASAASSWRFIRTEWDAERWGELYANLRHYGTSPTFGLQASIKLLLGASLYQALRDRPWGAERLRRFLLLALAGLLFASVLGVLEYFRAIKLDWWRPDNPDVIRNGFRRLQSLAGHPGWFAEYLGMLAPAALAMGLAAPAAWQRRAGWIAAIALVPVQFLTEARGGWLALAGGYAAVLAGWGMAKGGAHRWKAALKGLGGLALLLSACAGVLWLASSDFRARAAGLFLLRDRSAIWRSAWGLGHPIWPTGVGFGFYNWTHNAAYPEGHPFHELDKVTAHNLLLHVWTERGTIGLVLFLAILLGIYRSLFAGLARRDKQKEGINGLPLDLTLGTLGGITAFLIDGLVQYGFYIREIEILFWLLAGFAAWSGDGTRKAMAGRSGAAWAKAIAWTAPLACCAALCIGHHWLMPWKIWIESENFLVGGKRVEIAVPAQGTRFGLSLAALASGLDTQPQTLTIQFQGKTIRQLVFRGIGRERIELELPADRKKGERLAIEASRIWRPLRDSGMRSPPFPEIGALYTPLTPASP